MELIVTNYEEEKDEFSYKARNCNWSISFLKMNICSSHSERTRLLFRIWKTSFPKEEEERVFIEGINRTIWTAMLSRHPKKDSVDHNDLND